MTDRIERGKRGPAPSWNLGRTRSIRVPIALADTLLNIARLLDSGQSIDIKVGLTQEDKQEVLKSVGERDLLGA